MLCSITQETVNYVQTTGGIASYNTPLPTSETMVTRGVSLEFIDVVYECLYGVRPTCSPHTGKECGMFNTGLRQDIINVVCE